MSKSGRSAQARAQLPPDFSWLHLMVRVDLSTLTARMGSPRLYEQHPAITQLRAIERWLFERHVPQNLFHLSGAPRSDTVHVFFRSDQPHKTLAFRGLCKELGLSGAIDQSRVLVNRSTRLRPPLLDLVRGGL